MALGSCGGCRLTAIKLIKEGLPNLAEENLLNGCSVEQVFGRVHASDSLEDALDGADHLQENAPERVEIKQELYHQIDRPVGPQTVSQFDLHLVSLLLISQRTFNPESDAWSLILLTCHILYRWLNWYPALGRLRTFWKKPLR